MFILLNKGGDENLTSAQGGVLFLTIADKGGGVQKCQKSADIICEQYLC